MCYYNNRLYAIKKYDICKTIFSFNLEFVIGVINITISISRNSLQYFIQYNNRETKSKYQYPVILSQRDSSKYLAEEWNV